MEANRTDPARGINYDVRSSLAPPKDTGLFVGVLPAAPKETRRAVLGKHVAFTCSVPGDPIRYSPEYWQPQRGQIGTTLRPAHPVNVANRATTCMLWTRRPGSSKPFSRVRLR